MTHWGLGTETLRFLVIDESSRHFPSAVAEKIAENADGTRSVPATLKPNQGPSGECPPTERRGYGSCSALIIGTGLPQSRDEFERLVSHKAAIPVLPLFYRCVADRLFLPIDAELTPHVSDAELRDLLPSDVSSVLVWHPAAGLIQFESDQIPHVADLLRSPPIAETHWNDAKFGETLNDRIRSLNPIESDRLVDILQRGQDDIGKDAGDISKAPPSPDEVQHPKLNDAKRALQRMIAKGIFGITSRLPEGPGGSQALANLHQWAASLLSSLTAGSAAGAGVAGQEIQRAISNISSQRENELKRLLHLLNNDPDQGLRYALPLHGGSHRGQANPSGRLGERTPDFELGQLGGAGPADGWDLPWEYHVKLMQSYRDLAQREMRLANHRRAAYIYATLLGDLNAAATALEAGSLHRDAATIYEKHLNNPLKAAECLRNGGFWEDALVIYRGLSRWIEAGELHLKLDQPEEARIMFSNEIRSCESRRDFLKAGELADQRLQDPDQAAALLTKGWELNASAEKCFRALLDLHGQRGQHAQSRLAIQKLAGGPNLFVHQRADAVKVCSETAVAYPDAGVRDLARRQTWQIASAVLQDAQSELHPFALAVIRTLSKQDALLQQDAQRFAAHRVKMLKVQKDEQRKSAAKRTKVIPQPKTVVKTLVPVCKVQITPPNAPQGMKWLSGVISHGHCFVLGVAPDESLVLVESAQALVSETHGFPRAAFILRAEENLPLKTCELRQNGIRPRAWLQSFPASSNWNKVALERVRGQMRFLDVLAPQNNLLLDFMQLSTGTIWALFINAQRRLVLEAIGLNGLVRQTLVLDLEFSTDDNFLYDRYKVQSYRIHHDGARVIVLAGRHVWRIDSVEAAVVDTSSEILVKPTPVIEFPEAPLKMVASPVNTTLRLAFSFKDSAQAVWPMSNESRAFASGFDQPLIACTGNGLFVAACRTTGRIASYRLNAGIAVLLAEFEEAIDSDPIVDLMPGPGGNEFSALHASGRLLRLQIPVR